MAGFPSRLREVAHAHSAAEAAGDLDATLATLEAVPVYSFFPAGREFRGMAATRRYYEYFFANVMPRIESYALHGEWEGPEGLAQEYSLVVRDDDGSHCTHRIVGILTYGREKLTGERLYASDELLRFLVGPLWDELPTT